MIDKLSTREKELVRLLAAGMSTADIAVAMSITENTARAHTGNVFKKLGTTSRGQVANLWFTSQIDQLRAKVDLMSGANSAMLAALDWLSQNQTAAPEVFKAITSGAIAAGNAGQDGLTATEPNEPRVPPQRTLALAALVAQAQKITED